MHLLTLLQSRGVSFAAVALGALISPGQVGARILEMLVGRKAHLLWSLVASTVLVAVGLGMFHRRCHGRRDGHRPLRGG